MITASTLIWRLGIRGTYKGCTQMNYAVATAWENKEYLGSVTKLLYPEVAREFHTTPANVERNLRTVITVCWEHGNRALLEELVSDRLVEKPTTKDFINILVGYLEQHKADD